MIHPRPALSLAVSATLSLAAALTASAAPATAVGTQAQATQAQAALDRGRSAQQRAVKAATSTGELTLRKAAYLNVADKSSIAAVEATGTLTSSGGDAPTGGEVCFVYTVTNNSAHEIVLDSLREADRRIGNDGSLGGAGITLAPGADWKAFGCTTLKYLITHEFDD